MVLDLKDWATVLILRGRWLVVGSLLIRILLRSMLLITLLGLLVALLVALLRLLVALLGSVILLLTIALGLVLWSIVLISIVVDLLELEVRSLSSRYQ